MSHPQILRRIGVIGDIHCEDQALTLTLEFLRRQPLDLIVAVGDIADGRGDLNRTCALLEAPDIQAIRGNHERWFLKEEMRNLPDAKFLLEASLQTRAYLSQLPVTLTFETVAGPLLVCHGLGEDDMSGVWPHDVGYALDLNGALQRLLHQTSYLFVINGHTHRRMVKRIEHLTLINAGTLFYLHQPCFSIVDFVERFVQYYDLIENKIVEAESNSFTPPSDNPPDNSL